MKRRIRSTAAVVSLAVTCALIPGACAEYDAPPTPQLVGENLGVMSTAPDAPLVLKFSEPIKQGSLKVKLIFAVQSEGDLDGENSLLDEQEPPKTAQFKDRTILAFDSSAPSDANRTFGGKSSLNAARTQLTMEPEAPLPVGVPLMVLIEPGLSDAAGNETGQRIRVPIVFQAQGGGATTLPTGYYFMLMNVEPPPLAQQLRFYAYIDVASDTGDWTGTFTNAARTEALNSRDGCPSCEGVESICALFPNARCVRPSENLGSLDEFLDRLPQPDTPGFKFTTTGFAKDTAAGIEFGTPAFDIDINIGAGQINIVAVNTVITGLFKPDETNPDQLQLSGSLKVDKVQINGAGEAPTQGTVLGKTLSADDVAKVESFGTEIPVN